MNFPKPRVVGANQSTAKLSVTVLSNSRVSNSVSRLRLDLDIETESYGTTHDFKGVRS